MKPKLLWIRFWLFSFLIGLGLNPVLILAGEETQPQPPKKEIYQVMSILRRLQEAPYFGAQAKALVLRQEDQIFHDHMVDCLRYYLSVQQKMTEQINREISILVETANSLESLELALEKMTEGAYEDAPLFQELSKEEWLRYLPSQDIHNFCGRWKLWNDYVLSHGQDPSRHCRILSRCQYSKLQDVSKAPQAGISKNFKKETPPLEQFSIEFEYVDGNANVYQLGLIQNEPWIMYQPVSQAQSSSGMYDGGKPQSGKIAQEVMLGILEFVPQVADQKDCLIYQRVKGSSQFTYLILQKENKVPERVSLILAPDSSCQKELETKLKQALAQVKAPLIQKSVVDKN